jgi:hypothetical protein
LRLLVVAGIVLLLSGPLLVAWVYFVNPPDFYYNITAPVFDLFILGLAALGAASFVLSRSSLAPRYASIIGIAFILIPLAVFIVGNATTETACFGPCGNWPPNMSISGCSVYGSTMVCRLTVADAGSPHAVDATMCSIQVQKSEFPWGGNQTGVIGTLGDITSSLSSGDVFTCSIGSSQPSTGSFVYLFIHFSSGSTIGIGPYVWK